MGRRPRQWGVTDIQPFMFPLGDRKRELQAFQQGPTGPGPFWHLFSRGAEGPWRDPLGLISLEQPVKELTLGFPTGNLIWKRKPAYEFHTALSFIIFSVVFYFPWINACGWSTPLNTYSLRDPSYHALPELLGKLLWNYGHSQIIRLDQKLLKVRTWCMLDITFKSVCFMWVTSFLTNVPYSKNALEYIKTQLFFVFNITVCFIWIICTDSWLFTSGTSLTVIALWIVVIMCLLLICWKIAFLKWNGRLILCQERFHSKLH